MPWKVSLPVSPLDEQPILRAVDGHFHPVAAFKLKGHKVLAIVVAVHHVVVCVPVTVLAHLHTFETTFASAVKRGDWSFFRSRFALDTNVPTIALMTKTNTIRNSSGNTAFIR